MFEQVKREAVSAFSSGKQLKDNPYPSGSQEASVWSSAWTAEKLKSRKTENSSAFQTGAARAVAAITNKAASVGVRVGNADPITDGYSQSEPAYQKGRDAYDSGKTQANNPYEKGSPNNKKWLDGWRDAKWTAQRSKR